jgi:tetratricopeptide (TPR) repeat protein
VLEQAIALHREGRLKEAASLYRQFLNQNPDHAEALGLLGVTEVQAGNPSAGLAFLDRAIWLEPQNPILHNNRGNALRDLKRLEEARAAYDRALALKPDFAQARNNRGNVLSDLRRFEEAVANFDGLIRMQPQLAAAHFHRGNALQQLGRHADALSSFDRALFVKPDHADAHNNRGIALHQLKRSREALAAFDRSLAIRDSNPGCWNNRGNLLLDLKQLDEALANFDRALAIKPDYAQAFYNRGIVLREMKRLGESLESFNRAIALEPDNAKAHSGSGAVLCDLKRPEEALASLDRALALEPRYADALLNRGVALRDAKRFADAMESMDRAYALEPENAGVLNGRGVALLDVERFDEALTALDRALELEPDHAQAHYNRGMVLLNLNRPRDALASHARALALEPDYPDALFGEGVCHLTLGEFSRGWAGYEHRWRIRTPAFSRRSHGLKDWAGEDLRGRSILVYAEQGAGDTIQFARYLPLLASRGASVTFLVEERLLSLLGPLSDDVRLASNVRPGERFDFQCALLSIPYWLRTSLATIPPSAPYLYADPKRSAEWARRIGTHGFKVGIHWQGGLWQGGASIAGRSIPLREFQPLSQISGVRLISLQKNFGAEQLDRIPPGMRVERLDKFDDGPDAFLDSAAVIDCLDLVVTCDTSIAHLAGALAAPVWVALKNVPDWRWMVDRSDSPWYPTMRLFRQKTLGDWPGVFRAVAAAVKAAIAERSEDR